MISRITATKTTTAPTIISKLLLFDLYYDMSNYYISKIATILKLFDDIIAFNKSNIKTGIYIHHT